MSDTLVLNSDGLPLDYLPVSTWTWQDAIKSVYTDATRVIHEYEDWVVRSPSVSFRVPSVIMLRNYVRNMRVARFSDKNVFLRDRYTCQYCHKVFPESELTLDHVVPKKMGGKLRWDNIATACAPCNSTKGHSTHLKPLHPPMRPKYRELAAIRKEFPVYIPHESWIDYLDWPHENIVVQRQHRHGHFECN